MKRTLSSKSAVLLLLSACGGASPAVVPPPEHAATNDAGRLFETTGGTEAQVEPLEPLLARSCARTTAATLTTGTSARQGSTVALTRSGDSLLAYVADKDDKSLVVFDVTARSQVAALPLHGAPEQVMILQDGRVVVTIGDASHVEVFEPTADEKAPLQRLCARSVPAGPYGLAASRDGRTVAVTSAFEPTLTVLDDALASTSSIKIGRAPRSVWISDKREAFVAHLVGGNLSIVDLDHPEAAPKQISLEVRPSVPQQPGSAVLPLRSGSQEFTLASVEITHPAPAETPPLSGNAAKPARPQVALPAAQRLIIPMVTVDPGSADRPTENYYGPPAFGGITKQTPIAVVVDPSAKRALTTQVVPPVGSIDVKQCVQPRAAAGHDKRETMYVACIGTNQLLELDARKIDPMKNVLRRFEVPEGPMGVAVDTDSDVAVVYGQFNHQLGVVDLDSGRVSKYDVTGQGREVSDTETRLRRGRALFYQSDAALISSDSLACSSCHPDGLEDGLTWFTPEGPRQTPMLAGRLSGTAPYGWARHQKTLESYITDTAQRLGGNIKYFQVGDVATYVASIGAPPRRGTEADELVTRGKQIFSAKECSTCHHLGTGIDGEAHDFDKSGTGYDTPSLSDIRMTPPYFHDGRYPTLMDLLSDKESKMGRTSALDSDERVALEAYLETL